MTAPPLLPLPAVVTSRAGEFRLQADLAIATAEPGWAAVVRRLLAPGTGLELPAASDGALRSAAGDGE